MPKGDLRGPFRVPNDTWHLFIAWGADRGLLTPRCRRTSVARTLAAMLDDLTEYEALLASLSDETPPDTTLTPHNG